MADNLSFDCSATDLLCDEETKGLCFGDDDDEDDFVESCNEQSYQSKGGVFSYGGSGLEAPIYLPCLSEECVVWMVEREKVHLPRDDYVKRLRCGELDVSLRRRSLYWMIKVCAQYNYGELCLYSAMSYFDRFLSVYEFPVCSLEVGDRKWAFHLISVACLSLAAKSEEVHVPSTEDLQRGLIKQAGESNFVFEGKTIQRMEIMILNRLDWKIKAYTPCSFIDYYLRKMNNGEFPSGHAINRSLQFIIRTIEDIDFLEFRPSEIAAAVAIYVSREILQAVDIDKALLGLIGIEKGRVEKCLDLIQNVASVSNIAFTESANFASNVANGSNSISTSLLLLSEVHSPNGVLEAACLSYKCDERTVESCPSSSHTSPQPKRRKLEQTSTLVGDS